MSFAEHRAELSRRQLRAEEQGCCAPLTIIASHMHLTANAAHGPNLAQTSACFPLRSFCSIVHLSYMAVLKRTLVSSHSFAPFVE